MRTYFLIFNYFLLLESNQSYGKKDVFSELLNVFKKCEYDVAGGKKLETSRKRNHSDEMHI